MIPDLLSIEAISPYQSVQIKELTVWRLLYDSESMSRTSAIADFESFGHIIPSSAMRYLYPQVRGLNP
jgi:hypothetical protein